MDAVTEELVDYTRSFQLDNVPSAARQAARRHLLDAVGCVVAGHRTSAARAAAAVAVSVQGEPGATVFGAKAKSALSFAAMANTVAVRSLDWNDGMLARGGGHPSDMIPGVVAAGEAFGADGRDVIAATILAYELLGGLGKVADAYPRGWDQGLFMGTAVALAAGKVAGLTRTQLANAVSLAIVPAIPLLVTRRGELSMWKGAATSVAVQHGLHAMLLARVGMTGPAAPFAGSCGVFDQVTGGPFEVRLPANGAGPMVIELSHLKVFPAEGHSQALLELVPDILAFATPPEIESIEVEAYQVLVNAIGTDPSCWDPGNRETADHSLPYLLAVALVDGDITTESFTETRIADPALRPVMRKVSVTENPAYTAEYRKGSAMTADPHLSVRVRRRDGAVLRREAFYPKGHHSNPMTDADVSAKFDRACRGISQAGRDRIRQAWWHIESAVGLGEPVAALADLTS